MSDELNNDHVWFRERIAVALAGGLNESERMRFDAHAAACESCAAKLAKFQNLEQQMNAIFAHPAAGLEDRLIAGMDRARRRIFPPRISIHPGVARAATGIAAAVVLAGFGYLVTQKMDEGIGSQSPARQASTLHQLGAATSFDDGIGRSPYGLPTASKREFSTVNGSLSAEGKDKSMSFAGAGGGTSAPSNFFATPPGQFSVTSNTSPAAGYAIGANQLRGGERDRAIIAAVPALTGEPAAKVPTFQPMQLDRSLQAQTEQEKTRELKLDAPSDADALGQVQKDDTKKMASSLTAGIDAAAKPPSAESPQPDQSQQQSTAATRKVIRNGAMEFEVDHFDAAFAQVSKLTSEAGGYVGTTESTKLPNGKVRGVVMLRVPPDKLDMLILELRGIGDLKSQKLDAQDISKQYSDLDSELKADRAMEDRLLDLIKNGKGRIKDLLAAEKELGVWREKIEHIVGELKFYDSQVALATLNLTIYERDIRTPATATQTENVDAGMETPEVEKARVNVLKAIEDAKGRVLQSDLKQFDAGQFGATIVADVPPDAAGPLVDRLKQIGKLARLDVQRHQTASDDSNPSQAPVRVEKKNTRLNLSIYNLANVAPRESTTLNIAADNVEQAYHAIIARVGKTAGRIVNSNLARNKPEQTTATINFEVPAADADAVLNDLHGLGEILKLTMTENPDVNNVTTAKRGFALTLVAAASVAARESQTTQLAATSVVKARDEILSVADKAKARVLSSQLNENDPANPVATLELEIPRPALDAMDKAIASAGDVLSRLVTRSNDTDNTIDSKVKLQITIGSARALPPREQTALTIELTDVESAIANVQLAATQAGGRVVDSSLSKDPAGNSTGKLSVEVPLANATSIIDQAKKLGNIRGVQSSQNLQIPAGSLARARIDLTFASPQTIVEPGQGVWATLRSGFSTSIAGLLWSLELIVIGLCFVVPWALILWGAWKFLRRGKTAAAAETP